MGYKGKEISAMFVILDRVERLRGHLKCKYPLKCPSAPLMGV